jgi:hypothetical protein
MAEELHLLTRNWLYEPEASIYDDNGTTPEASIDNDVTTSWFSSASPPQIVYDLGSPKAASHLFVRHLNIGDYTLEHSTDAVAWTSVFTSRVPLSTSHDFFGFSSISRRYWQLTIDTPIGGTVNLYECLLANRIITLNDAPDQNLPANIVTDRSNPFRSQYRLANGNLVNVKGQKDKYEITLQFTNLPQASRDTLESTAFDILTLYPEPTEYPTRILQATLDGGFNLTYPRAARGYKGVGFAGDLRYVEI